MPRAFERFRRGAGATGHAGSLGLGMSLVARIASAHDGATTAVNLPDRGARVAFSVAALPDPPAR